MTTTKGNVFTLLDYIRARPRMYLGSYSLYDLETVLNGYYWGLGLNGLVEDVPSMESHFREWLRYKKRWSGALGWSRMIMARQPDVEQAFALFFSLVDLYRRLRPARVWTAGLDAGHVPAVQPGLLGRGEMPQRIDLMRYRPTPLHFLRYFSPAGVSDGDLSKDVARLKRGAEEEYGVAPEAWQPIRAPSLRRRGR